jgi:hypothetical protein
MEHMWNKIKHLVDIIEQDQAETPDSAAGYIFLKDFNKLAFRLYRMNDEEGEEEEEEGDEHE